MKYIVSMILVPFVLAGCTKMDMPKKTHEGYASARFVSNDAPSHPEIADTAPVMNAIIQNAIAGVVQKSGLDLRDDEADLLMFYVFLRKDHVSTETINSYFGYGHDEGSGGKSYRAGSIVIDVVDAATNELLYRSAVRTHLPPTTTDDERIVRVRAAVSEALAPFFQ